MTGAVSGTGDYVTLTPGSDIHFRQKATASSFRSEVQSLSVPDRPATPAFDFDYGTEATTESVPTDHEYADNAAMNDAISGTGVPASVVPGQTFHIRVKATASAFASEVQSLTIPARPDAPVFAIDFANEQTASAVPATVEYATASDMSGAVAGTGIALDVPPGSDLYFRLLATSSSFRSSVYHLDAPERTAASFAIDFDAETTQQSLTANDEVATLADMSDAQPGTGSVLDLTPGTTLYFRSGATASAYATNVQTLVVPDRPATPAFAIDFPNERTSAVVSSAFEYAATSAMTGAVAGTGAYVDIVPGTAIHFRRMATASSFRSAVQSLSVPVRAAAPSFGFVYATETTLEDVPADHEYADNAAMDNTISGVGAPAPVVPGQTFYIRVKATSTEFASAAQALAIPARPAAPSFAIDFINERTTTVVPSTMESSDSANMADAAIGNGTYLEVLPSSDKYIRYLATASAFRSEIFHLQSPARPMPAFAIDFDDETTQQVLTANDRYATQINMSDAQTGTGTALALTPGTTLYFQSGATASAYESLIQTLVVPARPATPAFAIDFANERTTATVSDAFEYASSANMTGAVAGNGSYVDITPGSDIHFRRRFTTSSFRSEVQSLSPPERAAAPVYAFEFSTETTTEIVPTTHEYADNAAMDNPVSGTGVPVSVVPGETFYIRVKATSSAFASASQALAIPARPAAPTVSIDFVNERTSVVIPATMEFAASINMSGAQPGSGAYIDVPPGSDLFIRRLATASSFRSEIRHLDAPLRGTPAFSIQFENETTAQVLTSNDRYASNSDMTGALAGTGAVLSLAPGTTLYFRTEATSSAYRTNIQTLVVPDRPAAPAFGINFAGERTSVTVTSDYEYASQSSFAGATAGTGQYLTLAPGSTVYFRKKATSGAFRSLVQTLPVPARPAAPAFGIQYANEAVDPAPSSDYLYGTNSDLSGAATGTGATVPVTPGQNLYLRKKATSTEFASQIQTLAVPARPAPPEIGIDFATEQTDVIIGNDMEHSVYADLTAAQTGAGEKLPLIPETGRYFRYLATTSSFRSGISYLHAPARPTISSNVPENTNLRPFHIQCHFSPEVESFQTDSVATDGVMIGVVTLLTATAQEIVYDVEVYATVAGPVSLHLKPNAGAPGSFRSETFSVFYYGTTDLGTEAETDNIRIYPNPTAGNVYLEIPSSLPPVRHLRVVSVAGAVVMDRALEGKETTQLELGHLKGGTYAVHLEGDGWSVTRKLMVEE
ncbi:MAG: T9SS type A sorting domain-containing protein [Bacteroidales bacterium]